MWMKIAVQVWLRQIPLTPRLENLPERNARKHMSCKWLKQPSYLSPVIPHPLLPLPLLLLLLLFLLLLLQHQHHRYPRDRLLSWGLIPAEPFAAPSFPSFSAVALRCEEVEGLGVVEALLLSDSGRREI